MASNARRDRFPWWAVVLVNSLLLFVVLFVLAYTGPLLDFYDWVVTHTTGRGWTYIMRDYPILLAVPAAAIVAVMARFLPLRYWERILLIDVVFLIAHILSGGPAPCDIDGDGEPDC